MKSQKITLFILLTSIFAPLIARDSRDKALIAKEHRAAAKHYNDLANKELGEVRRYKRLARRHIELAQEAGAPESTQKPVAQEILPINQ